MVEDLAKALWALMVYAIIGLLTLLMLSMLVELLLETWGVW